MSNTTIPAATPESPSCRRHLDPFAPELGGEIDVIANDPFSAEIIRETRKNARASGGTIVEIVESSWPLRAVTTGAQKDG